MSTTPLPTQELFGYRIHNITCPQGVDWADTWLQSPHSENLYVVTINPEIMMYGDENPAFADLVRSADLVLPDGAGVVWALKRKGTKIERLPGIEFSDALMARCAQRQYRTAFIGASPQVMDVLPQRLQERHPNLSIVYTHNGYFKDKAHEEQVAKDCAAANPQVLLVALGFPRQDEWIAQYRSLFQGTIFIGVGGSFDVWSGMVERAPENWRKVNMEWAYRFYRQPWRIRRAGKNLLKFVVKVLKEA